MGIKAGDLPLIAGAPQWLAGHFWNYIPLLLLTAYLCVAIYRLVRPIDLKKTDTTAGLSIENSATSTPEPLYHDRNVSLTEATITDGRIFLSSNIDPKALMMLCDKKTDVHAKRAVAPYIGKWMKYKGTINDVYVIGDCTYIRFKIEYASHLKAVIENDIEIADVLHIDDIIEIEGRISDIDIVTVKLIEAKILSR